MADPSHEMFACDACGRQFKWKPELSGKQVKCPCGQIMTAPIHPEPSPEDTYDLIPPRPPAANPIPPENAAAPRTQTAAHAPPPASAPPVASAPEKLRDRQVPLILLGIGIVIQLAAAWIDGSRSPQQFQTAMTDLAIGTVGGTLVTLVALFIATRIRGIKLGPFGPAVLKLAATFVAPAAAVTLIHPLLALILFVGPILGLAIQFALYFTLLGYFFDLDQSDTWYCICVMIAVAIAVTLAIKWM